MNQYIFAIPLTLALLGCSNAVTEPAKEKRELLQRFEQNEKFGFKDQNGTVVIEPIYDDAGEFACGLAPVNKGAKLEDDFPKTGGKWGYVNTQGKLVIPLTLEWACEFSDNLAQVGDKKSRRFIDVNGKSVIELENGFDASNFSEGLASIHINVRGKRETQTRCINKNGETVFTIEGYADQFYEGLAVLTVRDEGDHGNSRCGYIDRTGKIRIKPQFAEALAFSEGLAAVRPKKTTQWYNKGDSWGYIDKNGRFHLKPKFNEAHPFFKGHARVHLGGELTSVSSHLPPIWEGGEWQLIDRQGNVLKRSNEWVTYEVDATD